MGVSSFMHPILDLYVPQNKTHMSAEVIYLLGHE